MAVQCREGWLHYNADWYVLEPVDAGYRPVPAGTRSDTVLVTNLTNRLMPFIRYDQGDCILPKPGPCACDSAFPAMRVTGRTDDLLDLPARSGQGTVTVTPPGDGSQPWSPRRTGSLLGTAGGARGSGVRTTRPRCASQACWGSSRSLVAWGRGRGAGCGG